MPFSTKIRRLDLLGATILIAGLCCLLLALQWGGTQFSWRSARIIGLLVGSGLILILFFVIQWWLGEDSTMPLHVLCQRSVAFGSGFELLVNMSNYAIGYYLPFYFQAVQGVSATKSGVNFIALAFPEVLAIVIVGLIVTKTGFYTPYMVLGVMLAIVGTSLLSTIGLGTTTIQWAGYSVLTGIGIGMGIQVPYTAMQVTLKEKDVPSGNGILLLFQQLGGAIAVPIGNTIFINTLLSETPKHTTAIPAPLVVHAGAESLQHLSAGSATVLNALKTSYNIAVSNTLYLALASISLAIFFACGMEWKNIKREAEHRKVVELDKEGMSSTVNLIRRV